MKKRFQLLICAFYAIKINAIVLSGWCGQGVSYSLDTSTGVLIISGKGSMSSTPWNSSTLKTCVKTVEINNGVKNIVKNAFKECSVTSVTIPNSVTSIAENAFWGCKGLTEVTIPKSVTSIASTAFGKCSGLTSIMVDTENTKYESSNNCNAIIETKSKTLVRGCKNTIIPNSVSSFGDYAFSGCTGLSSIIIPDNVTSIGGWSFLDCSDLNSITISSKVSSIGYYAFSGCSGLTEVYCRAKEVPNTQTNAFSIDVKPSNATLYVIESSLETYKTTAPWSSFGNIKKLILRGDANGDGVVNVDDATFVTNIILGTEEATEAADVNKDGVINMSDVMFIVNFIKNGEFPDE